ncbi:MAG: hypothetical protein BJ554DRAFT_3234, partial [Olpidium bornovanus]
VDARASVRPVLRLARGTKLATYNGRPLPAFFAAYGPVRGELARAFDLRPWLRLATGTMVRVFSAPSLTLRSPSVCTQTALGTTFGAVGATGCHMLALADESAKPRCSRTTPPERCSLTILQQPQQARTCGFTERVRRLIDPPPVVKLIALDAEGVECSPK